MGRRRAGWDELARAAGAADRYGAKADKLARAAPSLPVLPGWVLEVRAVAALDASSSLDLARALLDLHPTPRWLLRSSSPLEDTAVSTAAGLFSSFCTDAVPEAVADALTRVAASATDPQVRAVLAPGSAMPRVPLAVLAQPHVGFRRWCTVEWRSEGALLEGWSLAADGSPEWTRSALDATQPPWHALRELATRVRAWDPDDRLLLELGEDAEGEVWLLQSRRAPRAAPHWPASSPRSTSVSLPRVDGLGAHVHRGDEDVHWQWDREHCPTALCPLLAGLFGAWILEHPEAPSRLVEGRWHDPAPRDHAEPELDLAAVERELADWRAREDHELVPALAALQARVAMTWSAAGATAEWLEFQRAWLRWQALYFSGNSTMLRRWARAVIGEFTSAGGVLPALGPTVASQRAARWWVLGQRLRAHAAPPVATAQALQTWAEDHAEDEIAADLLRELERCGHLCAFAFDGRGVPWEFEPLPFWRAIARRLRQDRVRARQSAPVDSGAVDARVAAACTILVRAEDDDDLLLRSYHLWHRALRRIHAAAGPRAPHHEADLLDLLPDDLFAWMQSWDSEHFADARARGRALARVWDGWPPATSPEAPADRLTGVAAAPGRAEAVAHRARHLEDLDLDTAEVGHGTHVADAAVVAVVSTVGPSDAVHLAGLAALVCEGGDVLGHASVLAREFGVPCVVGVVDARRRLAHAERLLVDGDRGEIVVTARRS